MARYPDAVWRPLPENDSQLTRVRKTLFIVHSQACKCGSLWDDFNRAGNGLESTFWVRRDGLVEQYLDSTRRADANRYVNDEAISVETDDDGDPDNQPWTDAQVESIIALANWAIEHPDHDIARARCTDPYGTGLGYHTMHGAPSAWTPVVKTCPGRVRVRQFDTVILPRLLSPVYPQPVPTPQELTRMLIDIQQGLVTLFRYPADVETWSKDQRTACAWWTDVAKQHGLGNALTLMAAEARKFGLIS